MSLPSNNDPDAIISLPAFSNESARVFLQTIANHPPARNLLQQLGGSVALCIKSQSYDTTMTDIPFLYLKAAAQHLTIEVPSRVPPMAAMGRPHQEASAEEDASHFLPVPPPKHIYEVVEAVGVAASQCQPRSHIEQSGILPVLASLVPRSTTSDVTNLSLEPLTHVHVELLQTCLYAQQYGFAEECVRGSWPKPTAGTTVKQVLRYYYLRGCIHINLRHWNWAIRCLGTCLVVPSDVVSAIAIAAWKKYVLVQCLHLGPPAPSDSTTSSSSSSSSQSLSQHKSPLQLSKAVPPCLTRFLKSTETVGTSTTGSSAASAASSAMAESEGPENPPYPQNPEDHHADTAMHMVESAEGDEAESQRETQPKRADQYKNLGVQHYTELVHAFEKRDRPTFDAIVQQHQTLFVSDGNMGLVQQCSVELTRQEVYYLSRIYAVVPLHRLATSLHLSNDNVRTLLRQLQKDLDWPIEIQNHTDMVVFPNVPASRPKDRNEDSVSLEQLGELTRMIQKLDIAISCHPKYPTRKDETSVAADAGKLFAGPLGVEDV